MIFYYLDALWDDYQTDELGDLCSSMNPFLFEGIGSADPAIWSAFCDKYKDNVYSLEESYEIAEEYISTLNCKEATKAINHYPWSNGNKAIRTI